MTASCDIVFELRRGLESQIYHAGTSVHGRLRALANQSSRRMAVSTTGTMLVSQGTMAL